PVRYSHSHSKRGTLDRCMQKYFFEYDASAKRLPFDAERKELIRGLKEFTGAYMLAGESTPTTTVIVFDDRAADNAASFLLAQGGPPARGDQPGDAAGQGRATARRVPQLRVHTAPVAARPAGRPPVFGRAEGDRPGRGPAEAEGEAGPGRDGGRGRCPQEDR